MILDRKAFMFNNFDKELFCFRKRLNLDFENEDKLRAAFVHPSFLHKISKDEDIPSFTSQNMALVEKLRSTGYSSEILTLYGITQTRMVVTSKVFNAFPNLPSTLIGEISNALCGRETITRLAEQLGIPEMIITEHDIKEIDSEKHVPFSRSDVICDAFFGLMGAILQDLGPEELSQFISDFVMTFLDEEEFRDSVAINRPENTASEVAALAGYKDKLEAQLLFQASDEVELPLYVVGVFAGDVQLGEGADSTLKKAEAAAFRNAIYSYMWIKEPLQDQLSAAVN